MTPVDVLRPLLQGDERFAVTGATGWFGRTALDLLDALLGDQAGERVTAYAASERTVTTAAGRLVLVRRLADLPAQDPAPTHLLHFAFLTRNLVQERGLERYVAENVAITAAVLDAVARARPRGLVVTSSGAVYGPDRELTTDLAGNPYGTLKHLDELAFRAAGTDVGAGVAVARVFSVAGPGITKPELYALGSLVAMAQRGGPLEVRAQGPVVRSYAAVVDVVALALAVALRGGSATFDTGGEVVEVGELATRVARLHGLPADAVKRTFDATRAGDHYVGDPATWKALASSVGLELQPLDELVLQTSQDLRQAGHGPVAV